MTNVAGGRILLALALVAAAGISVVCLTFLKFPENAIIVAVVVVLTTAFVFFVQKKEHAARFEAFYAAIQDVGTPIHFGKRSAAFERQGTRFEIEFPTGEHDPCYHITFFLPGVSDTFSIKSRSIIGGAPEGCYVVDETPLPQDFIVHARRPELVRELLNNRQIQRDVTSYGSSFWQGILIGFDAGSFKLDWAPPLNQQIDGIYLICQTAVLFHDELRKYEKK